MATTNLMSDQTQAAPANTALLISLASLEHEALLRTLANIALAFPDSLDQVLVATPDDIPSPETNLRILPYTPAAPSKTDWTLTAADFLNAHTLLEEHRSDAVLILGAEAQSLAPNAIRALADAVLMTEHCDLATPRYNLPPRAGLVNSAILYPTTRALFGTRPRFPLAVDLALSARAVEKLATVAQRYTAANQPDALLWPVSEIAVAGYTITEVEAGTRVLPQPTAPDLNALLAHVAGSLFADVEAKAPYWQRARIAPPSRLAPHPPNPADPSIAEEAHSMIDSFHLAFTNLQEIWSLVLPPQSLLGLKRLSVLPSASFAMPDGLWARIVYDFLLAYRLRTINRGHLLGAMTPLYLAWVASHLLQSSQIDPERHIEAVATAFEADKPYLVSRWRWPDRFNP
jgi:hypothetical protein